MHYRTEGDTVAVRLSIGDEIVASLAEICKKENILFGEISGIGAVSSAVTGLYSTEKKQYFQKELKGPLELVSLLGSVTEKEGEPYLHLHASFSDEECRCFGGHLNSAVIGVTGEIFIRKLPGKMGRRIHPVTGLNIFDI